MTISGPVLASLLGAGGLGAIIAAIVAGLFAKRKLGAEATEIISKAAAGVVTNMQTEIDRLLTRARERETEHDAELADQAERFERRWEMVRRTLQLHAAWDAIVATKLEEAGIDVPDAPPLLPPYLDDDEGVH